jgi:flagellar biogenesis protein FliO
MGSTPPIVVEFIPFIVITATIIGLVWLVRKFLSSRRTK